MERITSLAALFIFSFFSFGFFAQEKNDTTIHFREKTVKLTDSVGQLKVKVYETKQDTLVYKPVYEGVFANDKSAETYYVTNGVNIQTPFGSLLDTKGIKQRMKTHLVGMGFGFAGFTNNIVGAKPFRSFEYTFNFMSYSMPLYKNRLALVGGVGLSLRTYSLRTDKHFVENGGYTTFENTPAETSYSRNNLTLMELTFPLLIEWQPEVKWKRQPFVSLGFIAPVMRSASFNVTYKDKDGETIRKTEGKGMNIESSGIDLYGQIGYGNISAYCKYSPPYGLFDEKGPNLKQLSFGFIYHF